MKFMRVQRVKETSKVTMKIGFDFVSDDVNR